MIHGERRANQGIEHYSTDSPLPSRTVTFGSSTVMYTLPVTSPSVYILRVKRTGVEAKSYKISLNSSHFSSFQILVSSDG